MEKKPPEPAAAPAVQNRTGDAEKKQNPEPPTPEQEAQAAAAGPQFATEQARGSIMCAPDFFSHRFFALDANCRTWEQTHQWDFPIEDVGNSMCKLMVFPVPGGCIALCHRNEN